MRMVVEMWKLWKADILTLDLEREPGWVVDAILVCDAAYQEYQVREMEKWQRSR